MTVLNIESGRITHDFDMHYVYEFQDEVSEAISFTEGMVVVVSNKGRIVTYDTSEDTISSIAPSALRRQLDEFVEPREIEFYNREPWGLATSSDGRYAAVALGDQSIRLLSLKDGAEVGRIDEVGRVSDLAVLPKANAIVGILSNYEEDFSRILAWKRDPPLAIEANTDPSHFSDPESNGTVTELDTGVNAKHEQATKTPIWHWFYTSALS